MSYNTIRKVRNGFALVSVLALALMVTISGTALAASTTLKTVDTTTEFSNNEGSVSGTVNYTGPGMVITEGGYWQSSTFQLSESPDSLDYTIEGASAPVTVVVYDGSGTVIKNKTVSETSSPVSGSIDLSSTSNTSLKVEFSVPDDSDGTTGETVGVQSFSFTSTNDAPTVSVSSDGPAATGDTVTLTASGSDSDGDTLSYAWDLDGDGTYDDGTGTTVTVSESTAGDYTYDVQVSDGYGGTATDSVTVTFGTATIEITEIKNVDGSSINNPMVGIWRSSDTKEIVAYHEVTLPYTIKVEPGNNYNVWVKSANGDYIRSKQVVSAVAGKTHSLTYTLDYAGVAQFNLVDESGSKLDTYDVVFHNPDGSTTTLTFSADSTKELKGIPYQQYYDGKVSLTFKKDGYQSATRTYNFDDSNRIISKNVTLESKRVIDFNVQDVDGNAIEGATIKVKDTDGTVVATSTTDASGQAAIDGLSDQTYTVSVSATDYQTTSKAIQITSDGSLTAEMVLSSNVDEANGVVSTISYTDGSTTVSGGGTSTGGLSIDPALVIVGGIIVGGLVLIVRQSF